MNKLYRNSISMQQLTEKDTQRPQESVHLKIAYVLNSFPALSETFIRQEILELERQQLSLHIFSLSKPSVNDGAGGNWEGHTPLTYLATSSLLNRLLGVGQYFLKAPLRVLKTFLLTSKYYGLRSACAALLYAVSLIQQLECEQIHHVHAHYATEPTAVAQVVYLLSGIPYSFTAHAYDIYLSPRPTLKYKMQMARFIVTCTAYNQHYLEQINELMAERIYCIYHGLNLKVFPISDQTPLVRSQDPPCILTVSRLVEKKGLSYLIQACAILKRRGYRFTVRIAGEGPLRDILQREIHLAGLSENLSLLGSVAHEEVVKLYQQATIVALPCIIGKDGDRDGIPNVLVEALYMGLPVVSTPISGIPELISSEVNGLLVPSQDSNALADALARLLDDDELCKRLSIAGRQTVLEQFNMSRNATRLLNLFSTIEVNV